VSNALRFVDENGANTYAILGQTDPWSDDSNPPAPSPSATSVNEAFCAILATVNWVIENPSTGTYQFFDTQGNIHYYSILSTPAEVISEQSTIVMITATATGPQLYDLASAFRQIGFATNLVPISGHESDTFLPAANVSTWGVLEALENRVPFETSTESGYSISFLMQF
jgi:hypothetical protein